VDSFTAALSRLDPASRALLDLSLRRGMRPEEIGDLLGTDPESVIVAREGALEQLASELGMDDVSELDDVRARLAELPAAAWTGQAAAEAAPEPETAAVRAAEPEPRVAREPEPRRKSRLPLLLALLAIAAIVLVVVLASSGGDDKKTASTQQQKPNKPKPSKPSKPKPSKPATPKPGPTVDLTALSDAGGATGTAALTDGGKRLTVKVSGLRDAAYQVWLYDSVIDTVSLTKVRGTKLELDLKLPRNASHYRYVDISREPPDGNPNHSGESVLRVPLAKLSRG
jgi:Anti-sigma-K factor rskA